MVPVLGMLPARPGWREKGYNKEWFTCKGVSIPCVWVENWNTPPPKLHIHASREAAGSHNRAGPLAEEWSQHHQHRVVNMGNCLEFFKNFFCRQKNTNVRISLPAVCFVWQIAMIILFGVFIRYDEESDVRKWLEFKISHNITSDIENDFYFRYPSKYKQEIYLQ